MYELVVLPKSRIMVSENSFEKFRPTGNPNWTILWSMMSFGINTMWKMNKDNILNRSCNSALISGWLYHVQVGNSNSCKLWEKIILLHQMMPHTALQHTTWSLLSLISLLNVMDNFQWVIGTLMDFLTLLLFWWAVNGQTQNFHSLNHPRSCQFCFILWLWCLTTRDLSGCNLGSTFTPLVSFSEPSCFILPEQHSFM